MAEILKNYLEFCNENVVKILTKKQLYLKQCIIDCLDVLKIALLKLLEVCSKGLKIYGLQYLC